MSGYGLPGAGTTTTAGTSHQHSLSFSGVHSSPDKRISHGFSFSNGGPVRKAVSNNALYTHAETSRETSPLPSPQAELQPHSFPALQQNDWAVKQNSATHTHAHHHNPHDHTRSWSPMKSRSRGDSNLGDPQYRAQAPPTTSTSSTLSSWLSLPEALTSFLVPLPYVLASATFSSMSGGTGEDFPPLAGYEARGFPDGSTRVRSNGIVETGLLTAGTLLAVGFAAEVKSARRSLDRRKQSTSLPGQKGPLPLHALQLMLFLILSLGLPFYASMQLGGTRVGLLLLVALTLGLATSGAPKLPSLGLLHDVWTSKVASTAVVVLCFITDEAGFTINNSLDGVILGYLALGVTVLALPPPFLAFNGSTSTTPNMANGYRSSSIDAAPSASLPRLATDNHLTLAAGLLTAAITALLAWFNLPSSVISTQSLCLAALTILSMTSAMSFTLPTALRSQSKAGLALGCLTTASFSFLFSPSLWPGTIANGGLSALAFLSVLYDTNTEQQHEHHHGHHDHEHEHEHTHGHTYSGHSHHHHTDIGHSFLTKSILARCEPGSLVYSILSEKDSRRIAYFTILNFSFMLVQGVYGYISGSLGLLSDTVHMFFDCLGLVVGLGAAVASKWPTSPEKPYGWGKLNTLAGFGNGVFLMLVSIEFVWEAIEGMLDQRELRHVQELLVVSTLGMLVNLVGLVAFGHAHAGHDHGHSHGHSHSHGHEHSHANGHAHNHDCADGHDHKKELSGHGHHNHNDNMHGIFLHVAADAGGSLAVIISTALTLWKPWYIWDPLATIIIAILIFAAAVPLVVSSGQKLLLVIPDDLEYSIKNTLQGLGELRGVVGYAAPRFWLDDKEDSGEGHDHGHDHGHTAQSTQQKVQGVIHIVAAPSADLEDVRERVEEYTLERHMDLVIHVEREGDGQCWCGGAGART